mmetsp:Transcript_5519/g.22897  ORF Transcript_5519/g.22897 Transcript_5519/m.22897 type:complete len:402 (-) Transcript_5519:121-1326(-)
MRRTPQEPQRAPPENEQPTNPRRLTTPLREGGLPRELARLPADAVLLLVRVDGDAERSVGGLVELDPRLAVDVPVDDAAVPLVAVEHLARRRDGAPAGRRVRRIVGVGRREDVAAAAEDGRIIRLVERGGRVVRRRLDLLRVVRLSRRRHDGRRIRCVVGAAPQNNNVEWDSGGRRARVEVRCCQRQLDAADGAALDDVGAKGGALGGRHLGGRIHLGRRGGHRRLRRRRRSSTVAICLVRGEDAALADVAAEPDLPAVQSPARGSVDDEALGELVVVLHEDDDALVEVLLPQREAERLLEPAEQDRALLEEGRLVRPRAARRSRCCCCRLCPCIVGSSGFRRCSSRGGPLERATLLARDEPRAEVAHVVRKLGRRVVVVGMGRLGARDDEASPIFGRWSA